MTSQATIVGQWLDAGADGVIVSDLKAIPTFCLLASRELIDPWAGRPQNRSEEERCLSRTS